MAHSCFFKNPLNKTTLAAALLVLGLAGGQAVAAETLTLSSWLPPTHPVVVNAIKPWAKQVHEATGGNVRIRVLAKPLGSPLVHFDLAKDGVTDIAYGLQSYTKGDRFHASNVAQMPFMGENAEALSVAYWQAAEKYPAIKEEHEGTHVLSLFTHGPGILYNRVNPVASKADLQGLKIRVPGGMANDLVEGLGGTQMLVSPSEIYESLSRGVIDGLTMPAEPLVSYNLMDAVKHITVFPGGLYNTTWFLVMNQSKWDNLAKKDQDAIMSVSGEAFAHLVGQAWDDADAAAWEQIKAAGIPIVQADDAFVAEVKAVAEPLESAWAAKAAERGVDGAAMLAEIRKAGGK